MNVNDHGKWIGYHCSSCGYGGSQNKKAAAKRQAYHQYQRQQREREAREDWIDLINPVFGKTTEKAMQINLGRTAEDFMWVPKSVVRENNGGTQIRGWFARANRLVIR